jgi:hypothetical protein
MSIGSLNVVGQPHDWTQQKTRDAQYTDLKELLKTGRGPEDSIAVIVQEKGLGHVLYTLSPHNPELPSEHVQDYLDIPRGTGTAKEMTLGSGGTLFGQNTALVYRSPELGRVGRVHPAKQTEAEGMGIEGALEVTPKRDPHHSIRPDPLLAIYLLSRRVGPVEVIPPKEARAAIKSGVINDTGNELKRGVIVDLR